MCPDPPCKHPSTSAFCAPISGWLTMEQIPLQLACFLWACWRSYHSVHGGIFSLNPRRTQWSLIRSETLGVECTNDQLAQWLLEQETFAEENHFDFPLCSGSNSQLCWDHMAAWSSDLALQASLACAAASFRYFCRNYAVTHHNSIIEHLHNRYYVTTSRTKV